MLLSPAIVFFLGAYLSFLVVRYLLQLRHHRQLAKSLGCEPTTRGGGGFLGLYGFFKLSQAVKEKRWVEFIADQYQTYGNTVRQVFLSRTIISTIEPENIKAILATQFKEFGLGTRHREFYPLLGDGIFTLDGAGWSHARGLLRPQFARDQVADLDLMDDHIRNLVDLIRQNDSGASFDIQRLFFLLTIDSATHFLFGESVGSMVPAASSSATGGLLEKSSVGNAQGFAEAFGTAQDYLASRSRSQDAYWMINPQEFQDANRRVHEVVDHYVQLALESQQDPEKKQSAGGRYIFAEALAAETSDPKVMRDNMLNILLAGRDTTASLLSSVFFYLARNQPVWHKLRKVIIDEFGDCAHPKTEITQTKLKDIPYLRYVLNETLRLQPPVPLNFRVANKDTSLPLGGGPDQKSPIYIKKGYAVAYSVWAMHRRTDFYGPDAHTFRPERWEENGRHGWEYLPFNGGPRICLGRKFSSLRYPQEPGPGMLTQPEQYALTEASYTVVRLLQHFDTLENADPLAGDEPLKLSNLTMSHDRGVWIKLGSSEKA